MLINIPLIMMRQNMRHTPKGNQLQKMETYSPFSREHIVYPAKAVARNF